MRTAIKSGLFRACRTSGLHAAVRDSGWRSRRLTILCYHGVSIADEHEALPELYVQPVLLRRRLAQIRAGGYCILALDEALRRLADGTLPPRSVALTFDDGTCDFARVAVPLLREFDAPATVYPTTFYADRGQPIFDTALVYVLWRGRHAGADLREFAGADVAPGLATSAARLATATAIHRRAAADGLGADAKDLVLRRIAERVGVDYDAIVAAGLFQVMSAEEMRGLPRPLIDVQLHTHRHRVPSDPALLAREIADNRLYLARAGVESSGAHFCYPNGVATAEAAQQLRRLGVRSGTTCTPGLATRGMDPLRLSRFVDTAAVGDEVFEARLSGTAALLPRRGTYGRAARAPAAAHGDDVAAAGLATVPSWSSGAGSP